MCLPWAPLLALSIVLAQFMNSVTIGYFEHLQMGPTPRVVNTNVPQLNDRLLDAQRPALATVGAMRIALPPDRASDSRPSPPTTS
jgi:hypothetical protein